MNFIFTSSSTYLAVVVVPGRILVDLGFLVVAGRAVLCESEFAGSLAPASVTILGPLLAAESSVSETENGWLWVLVTDGGRPLAAETSMFSVFETEFGSISWLCSYIQVERSVQLNKNISVAHADSRHR